MSEEIALRVSGLEEVQKMLTTAPQNIVLLGFARAGRAGINVVASAVATRIPISAIKRWNPETFSEISDFSGGGTLASAMKVQVVVDNQARGVLAQVHFGNQSHIAEWVEWGHRMVTHKPGKRVVGEVPAHPFMRPAVDASAEAAIDAFANSLAGTLQKGVL